MSDWDATYDGVAAANNGLDLEMPSPRFMSAKTLLPAVQDGPGQRVHHRRQGAAHPAHRVALWLHRPSPVRSGSSTYSVADRPVALEGALESITLLKNEGHLLPLDAAKIKTIAIIGPDAWPAVPGGGGSSDATAFEPVSIVTGIANLVGPDVARALHARPSGDERRLLEHAVERPDQGRDLPQQGLHRHAANRAQPQYLRLQKRVVGSARQDPAQQSATPPASRRTRPASICSWPPPPAAINTPSPSTASSCWSRCRLKARSPSPRRSTSATARPSPWSPITMPAFAGVRLGLGIIV